MDMLKIREFNQKKNMLCNLLSDLEKLLIEEEMDISILKEIRSKLIKNRFNIVVVGEFSSGKSTFINALLGKKLLPAKVRPTTAIISVVEKGAPDVIVYYKTGEEKHMEIDHISSFATALDEEGEEEARKVKFMRIKYPSDFTEEGVRIIDTPGVEDLDKQREEITYNMIPKADVAILLMDGRRPFKKSEKIFLEEKLIGNNIKKIFFVMNFMDLIDEEEAEEVLEYTHDKLRRLGSVKEPKLFGISSKKALKCKINEETDDYLESFKDFEEELQEFLVKEKGTVLLSNSIVKSINILDNFLSVMNFKLKSLDKPIEEIEKKNNSFKENLKDINIKKASLQSEIINAFEEILPSIGKNLYEALGISINKLSEVDFNTLNQDNLEEEVASLLKDYLLKELEVNVVPIMNDKMQNIIIKSNYKLNEILIELSEFRNNEFDECINDNMLDGNKIYINLNYDKSGITKSQFAMGVGAYFGVPFIVTLVVTSGLAIIPIALGYALSTLGITKWGRKKKKEMIIKNIREKEQEIVQGIEKNMQDEINKVCKDYLKEVLQYINIEIKNTETAIQDIIRTKNELINNQNEMKNTLQENINRGIAIRENIKLEEGYII